MGEVTIQTLTDFTRLVEETCHDQDLVLFRGQCGPFSLIPAIARERLTGLDVLEAERWMLDEFQRTSIPYLHAKPDNLWEWAALAQHHGLPTRLLDWSMNPLTSLWFAIAKSAVPGQDGELWMLRPSEEDRATDGDDRNTLQCRRHLVFAPRHITERITAQVAWFTIHRARQHPPKFEPLEDSPEFQSKLTRISIPANRFAHFRFHLDHFGFNDASVFPGLDGVCAYIKWQRCFMRDEGDPNKNMAK